MEKKCIGIDVGGTTVKIGIFGTDGSLLEKWEVPTQKGRRRKEYSFGCCCLCTGKTA